MPDSPLIVTALLPDDLHSWATRLRDAHFPAERNYLEAHVTLFHALPPSCEDEVKQCLASMAKEHAPVPARLLGIMKLGKGTALKLESEEMIALWRELQDRFHGMLTPQDEHKPRLHVTIQNKVSIEEAKALQAQLAPQVQPRDFAFKGLGLYSYEGGPWEHIRSFNFRG
ncbi:2'-5' RNA ligase family protein [Aurantiacibacter aquimixticola]|uniref:2'-5' RNA ligase family protein n=1 Tax=Aurantiacibacter aquimixticola TaxID=1958945 RepID=A0A419RSD2_9SPHN|nr:2'-5' RNA ligase family protein [Aurantiacibacter aquimixticola]RJY08686.1 2'-5' RNA ligase family protein [Aurantiacibacter aquimixticola]